MSGVVLSVSVMTHPARIERARWLAARTGARLAVDPLGPGPGGAARTAALAWGQVPPDATHHLVVQDDITPRAGFVDDVTDAVRHRTAAMWNFYSNWNSQAAAVLRIGALWGCTSFEPPRQEYASTLAAVLPRVHAIAFAARLRSALADGTPDDIALREYVNEVGLPLWQSIPNLVEHDDEGDSLVGNNKDGRRRSGYVDDEVPFEADGPALRLDEIPYCPWVPINWYPRLFFPDRRYGDTVPLDEALGILGLTRTDARARYARDTRTLAQRYPDPGARAAIRADGWRLWLAGVTYGALTARTGRPVRAGDRVQRALWRTLVNGCFQQRDEALAPGVRDCLAELIALGFAAECPIPTATADHGSHPHG